MTVDLAREVTRPAMSIHEVERDASLEPERNAAAARRSVRPGRTHGRMRRRRRVWRAADARPGGGLDDRRVRAKPADEAVLGAAARIAARGEPPPPTAQRGHRRRGRGASSLRDRRVFSGWFTFTATLEESRDASLGRSNAFRWPTSRWRSAIRPTSTPTSSRATARAPATRIAPSRPAASASSTHNGDLCVTRRRASVRATARPRDAIRDSTIYQRIRHT